MVDCFPMFSGTCAEWATAFITLGAVLIALRTLDSLVIQAAAALKQAQAITQSERAYVFAKVVLIQRLESVDLMLTYKTEFKNYGKTPANVVSMDTDSWTITTSDQIRFFSLSNQDWAYPDGLVIAGGLQWGRKKPVISIGDWKDISEDKKRFYCMGLIRYRDVFGDHWETGYCWEYVARQNRFRMCEEATHLNYCRPYNPPDTLTHGAPDS